MVRSRSYGASERMEDNPTRGTPVHGVRDYEILTIYMRTRLEADASSLVRYKTKNERPVDRQDVHAFLSLWLQQSTQAQFVFYVRRRQEVSRDPPPI